MPRFEDVFQSSRLSVQKSFSSTQPREMVFGAVTASKTAPFAILVAVCYYLGSVVGFAMTPAKDPIATFWPPNAILLAALLLSPGRMWIPVVFAVIPAHMLVQVSSGVPPVAALGWYIGNVSEAFIGASLIRRFSKTRSPFDSVGGLIAFILFGGIVAPLLTSFLDAAVVVVSSVGRGYWVHWFSRQLSNMLAQLTVVPTIMIACLNMRTWVRRATRSQYVEAALLVNAIAAIGLFVFGAVGQWRLTMPALLYLPLPVLLWAALRFGLGGLSASLLAITLTSIWSAMHGRGPFTLASMADNILSLHVLLCTIAIPLMLLAAVMRERRLAEDDLRNAASRIISAQEQASQRIAQELHDGLGQQLAMVQMELDEIRGQAEPRLKDRLDRLYEDVSEATHTAREISHGLHPARLEHLGLVAAVKSLGSEISAAKPIRVQVHASALPEDVPHDVSLCLYRVAQEALQNVAKHSHAENVSVDLRVLDRRLLLRIVDNGIGLSSQQPGYGLGLDSMRERVRSVGGTIKIGSAPKAGTEISASIPLPAPGLSTDS